MQLPHAAVPAGPRASARRVRHCCRAGQVCSSSGRPHARRLKSGADSRERPRWGRADGCHAPAWLGPDRL